MKLFEKMKDGGPLSCVTGYFLIESKKWFTIVLLRFDNGSREAYHSHAFNALSWVLKGFLAEHTITQDIALYKQSLWPIYTPRSRFHKVESNGTTWVLSFRGPWADTWEELIPDRGLIKLTHGRKEIACAA